MGRFSRLKQGIGGIPAEVLLPGDTAIVKRFQGAINVIRRSAGFPNFEIAQEVLGFLTPSETKSVEAAIMGKYVGENEANLRAAFRETRARQAILFFDEVDSLLHARERAVRGWEVSLVNQLLAEFEAFGGVFLAATNHLDLVDRAALRRFQMKIGFRCLTREGRRLLHSRLLAPICAVRPREGELAALDGMTRLVPADFHVVRGNLQLFPERCTHRVILEALAAEAALRGEQERAPIGFRLQERQGA